MGPCVAASAQNGLSLVTPPAQVRDGQLMMLTGFFDISLVLVASILAFSPVYLASCADAAMEPRSTAATANSIRYFVWFYSGRLEGILPPEPETCNLPPGPENGATNTSSLPDARDMYATQWPSGEKCPERSVMPDLNSG